MDPKAFPEFLKAWSQVIHTVLTLVLFVALMFGGDSTRITEAMKSASESAKLAEELQKQLFQLQAKQDQTVTLLQTAQPVVGSPKLPCGPDCPCQK